MAKVGENDDDDNDDEQVGMCPIVQFTKEDSIFVGMTKSFIRSTWKTFDLFPVFSFAFCSFDERQNDFRICEKEI